MITFRWRLVFLLFAVAVPAGGSGLAPARAEAFVRLDDVGTGTLLLRTDRSGAYIRAPMVSSHFDLKISGSVVRATLSQRFRNPADSWVEGRYAFPLPDEAAVDGLRMRIGDRFIEGAIRERQQARADYERARAEGRKASLVEQHRPNLFTNDVANIGPGETVVVQISWLQTLSPQDGAFELRLPLVVAPRYNPDPVVQQVDYGPNGWTLTDPVPDRQAIESPLHDPRGADEGAVHNPVTMDIDLMAGFPLARVESRHHEIAAISADGETRRFTLSGPVPADRDFVLTWAPALNGEPATALFRERVGDRDYYVALLTPPEAGEVTARAARDIIFVQDVSGSMSGESIRQAREGLSLALRRLRPEDRFNLIVFNTGYAAFSQRPVPASPAMVGRALDFVSRLEAEGGTEMLPALQAALDRGAGDDDGRLRQIVFLTDGAVGNEAVLLTEIDRRLGSSRLFTVGIGSAPNAYFMTRAAELGRGSSVTVDDLTRVADQMDRLFAKLETPVLTDLDVTLPGGAEGLSPSPMPDLYAGDPIVLAFHLPAGAGGMMALSAAQPDGVFQRRIALDTAVARPGIAKLWARKRVRALEGLALSAIGQAMGRSAIDAQILETALAHGIVSRLTALVAVDARPARSKGAPLGSVEVPLNLPAGWNPEIFLDRPQPQGVRQQRASLSPDMARHLIVATAAESGAAPPRGSLNWVPMAQAGGLALFLALVLWLLGRWHGRRGLRPG